MDWLRHKKGSTFSASIFLAATTVGAGFVSLPRVTGIAGFWPAVFMSFLAWAYMTACCLLYMEALLLVPDGGNVLTICLRLIGKVGAILGVVSFALINYPFLTTYFAIGQHVVNDLSMEFFSVETPGGVSCLIIALVIGAILFLGVYVADRVMLILSAAAIIAFAVIFVLGQQAIDRSLLGENNWYFVFFALAALVSSFGSSAILPTLATHVGRDPKKCRRIVIIGMTIPLVILILWQWVTIGTVTKFELWTTYKTQTFFSLSYQALQAIPLIRVSFNFFFLFALLTSFIGLGMAVLDVLGDLFKLPPLKRVGWKRVWLSVAVMLPTALTAYLVPTFSLKDIFRMEGWAEAFFNGILPIWLVIQARYVLKLDTERMLPGGKIAIVILAIASFFLVYLQGVQLLQ